MDFAAELVLRAKADPALMVATGLDATGEARLEEGMPGEIKDRFDLARVTFALFSPGPSGQAVVEYRVQFDIWTWDDLSDAIAVDEALEDLLDQQWWVTAGGHRIYGRMGGFRDYPGPRGGINRRKRDFTFTASS